MFLMLTFLLAGVTVHYYKLAQKLQICPVFQCLSRQGIERRKPGKSSLVVFFDIDDMKGANSRFGYEEVNYRIAKSLRETRAGDVSIQIGRWFSGDEFVSFACDKNISDRIKNAFLSNGLSVTVAYKLFDPNQTLGVQVDELSQMVLQAKSTRGQKTT